jgi:hypothetical protein
MRTTTFKSRAFALVSTAALLATLVVAAPANAAATGPTCDGATPVQTCTGTTSDGAAYKMVVPATFNGTVTIWSHGFTVKYLRSGLHITNRFISSVSSKWSWPEWWQPRVDQVPNR